MLERVEARSLAVDGGDEEAVVLVAALLPRLPRPAFGAGLFFFWELGVMGSLALGGFVRVRVRVRLRVLGGLLIFALLFER
jgi:hypothetical protein